MGKLTKRDVQHVARLANLTLTPKEVEKFRQQLSTVIAYIEELKEVDTSGTEPTSQTTGLENVTREDEVEIKDCLTQEEALSGTEKVHNGYFVVPGIFTQEDE